jgi:hypothetical protein
VRCEQIAHLVGRHRSLEKKPLGHVAVELAHRRELPLGFDALGDRPKAERVRETHEVGRDRRVPRVVLDALDERAVDLDQVDREAAQLAQ